MNTSKTRFITLAIAFVLFLILLGIAISIFFFNVSKKPQMSPSPTVSVSPINQIYPPAINTVPTLPEEQGGGIDLESSLIQSSTTEIQKLYAYLPYEQDITLSTGESVSILIPSPELQEDPWVLTAQIFNLNYNTSADQSDYQTTKTSFLEATSVIFSWAEQRGADPNKIIFSWGDKKFIQDQVESWLKERY